MAQQWYVAFPDGATGPYSAKELRDLASSGLLRPSDRISPDGKKWYPAERVRNLSFGTPSASSTRLNAPAIKRGTDSTIELPTLGALQQKTLQEGDIIPGYQILDLLGAGAMGSVYRAKQIKLDREVALKTVRMERHGISTALARFEKEAQTVARLRHPNIVTGFDYGHEGDLVWFVMELLEGETAEARLDAEGRFPERLAWHIARQTAAGLMHAAEQGIVHRDIKPGNLFLTKPPAGYPLPNDIPLVKITDFGLALLFVADESGEKTKVERLTAINTVVGTPAYMAPEQFGSSTIDHRADIYALGATVAHMLSGGVPFLGETIWDIMIAKREGRRPFLPENLSEASRELLDAMLAPEPDQRLDSYAELLEWIDSLPCLQEVKPLSGIRRRSSTRIPIIPAEPLPTKPNVPSRRRFLIAGTALTTALVTGGLWYFLQPTKPGRLSKTGAIETLFEPKHTNDWQVIEGVAAARLDNRSADKDSRIFRIAGTARRRLPNFAHFLLSCGVDPRSASAVEILTTLGDAEEPNTLPRVGLRIEPGRTVQFGRRETLQGKWEPLARESRYPDPSSASDNYQSVTLERRGDWLLGFFEGNEIGARRVGPPPHVPWLYLVVEGPTDQPVSFESIAIEERIAD